MQYIENKIINFFTIFVIVLIIIFTLISFFYYQPYIHTFGEVEGESVNIYLTDEEISNLNFKLKYNDKIMDYEIKEISKEYFIVKDEFKKKVEINFDYILDKYILELYIGIGEKTNFWNYLYKKFVKGVL